MDKINQAGTIGLWTRSSRNNKGTVTGRNRKTTKTKRKSDGSGVFKKCASCNHGWETRDSYLSDPQLRIVGYQANFESPGLGTFMFSHLCGTTMSISAHEFVDLYTGHIFNKLAKGSRECPKYCLDEKDLKSCEVPCECAYIRKVALIIQHWPKNNYF